MDQQLEGVPDMPILKTVSLGSLDGYGVLLPIRQISKDRLEIPRRRTAWSTCGFRAPGESRRTNRITGSRRRGNAASKPRRKSGIASDVISGIMATTHEEV